MFRSAQPVTARSFNTLAPVSAQAMQVVNQNLAAQQRMAEHLSVQGHRERVLAADQVRDTQRTAQRQRELVARQQEADFERVFRAEQAAITREHNSRNDGLEKEYLQARINATNRSNLPSGNGGLSAGLFPPSAPRATPTSAEVMGPPDPSTIPDPRVNPLAATAYSFWGEREAKRAKDGDLARKFGALYNHGTAGSLAEARRVADSLSDEGYAGVKNLLTTATSATAANSFLPDRPGAGVPSPSQLRQERRDKEQEQFRYEDAKRLIKIHDDHPDRSAEESSAASLLALERALDLVAKVETKEPTPYEKEVARMQADFGFDPLEEADPNGAVNAPDPPAPAPTPSPTKKTTGEVEGIFTRALK